MLISKTAMEADRTVAIYSLPRLLGMLRGSYDDDALYSLNDLIDRLCSVDLLHVDDVGAEQSSPWVLEQLYTIINTRYEDGRAVLVTTNLGDPELRARSGTARCRGCTRCARPIRSTARTSAWTATTSCRSPPGPAGAGRWLSDADRAWEDADPDEPPAYGRPRRTA